MKLAERRAGRQPDGMVFQAIGDALARLVSAVEGRRVVPPVPTGRRAAVPAVDAVEQAAGTPTEVADPLALFIRYVDAKGDESQRRITVRRLIGLPPTMMLAWCHERRAPRNFRLDRIGEAICPETGEVFTLPALLVRLEGGGCRPVDPMLRRAVNILVFLMRCDGTAHPAEWAAIDAALAGFIMRFGGDDADHAEAMRLAREIAPDADDFVIGMQSFAASTAAPQLARWLEGAVMAVIDADDEHSDEEFAWLAEVAAFIRLMRGNR